VLEVIVHAISPLLLALKLFWLQDAKRENTPAQKYVGHLERQRFIKPRATPFTPRDFAASSTALLG
jgi:hypothetical protein